MYARIRCALPTAFMTPSPSSRSPYTIMNRKTVLKAAMATAVGAMVAPLTACAGFTNPSSLPYQVNASAKTTESDDDLKVIKSILAGNNPATWVCTGDSITQGAAHSHGWRHYVQHFEEHVRWDLGRKWDFFVNTGVTSERTGHILQDFDLRVSRFSPDVVTLMIGTNDATLGPGGRKEYRKNLKMLAERIRDTGAIPIFLTFNPVRSEQATTRTDLPAYVDIMREVAIDHKIVLVDNYKYWESQGATALENWLSDAIHPNEVGHLMMALLLFDRLGIDDPNGSIANLPIAS